MAAVSFGPENVKKSALRRCLSRGCWGLTARGATLPMANRPLPTHLQPSSPFTCRGHFGCPHLPPHCSERRATKTSMQYVNNTRFYVLQASSEIHLMGPQKVPKHGGLSQHGVGCSMPVLAPLSEFHTSKRFLTPKPTGNCYYNQVHFHVKMACLHSTSSLGHAKACQVWHTSLGWTNFPQLSTPGVQATTQHTTCQLAALSTLAAYAKPTKFACGLCKPHGMAKTPP